MGFSQSDAVLSRDSQAYWASPHEKNWRSNSHWRDAPTFSDNDVWDRIGRRHRAMLDAEFAPAAGRTQWGRVVEWGCGGGANAVQIAPDCSEFIGVDVASATLDECAQQVRAVCETPFRPVLIDVAEPEGALAAVDGPCDLFVSFYVFELLPTPEYGARILRIAEQLLSRGGHAMIQVKYDDGTWRTRARRRSYRFGLADMTTYPIAGFWELASACGLEPLSVRLRPRDELDERYAYFSLRKP